MIDWLTLRLPLIGPVLRALDHMLVDRMQGAASVTVCYDHEGREMWSRTHFDYTKLRSDTPGLFWSVACQGEQKAPLLVIGGSPAAVEHKVNVFGSEDIRHCADVLLRHARRCLNTFLPPAPEWQIRRCDVTQNFDMGSVSAVSAAQRELLKADRALRFPARSIGECGTVGFNYSSDLRAAKVYAKGPQLRHLLKTGQLDAGSISPDDLLLADRLLRAELKLGSRFWRRFEENNELLSANPETAGRVVHWWQLPSDFFRSEWDTFFGPLFGSCEVVDMGDLLDRLRIVAPSEGHALAAHRTWALIRAMGHDQARASMPRSTWFRHLKYLRAAGLSDTDLSSGEVVPFLRRRVEAATLVTSWDQLRRAA